MFLPSWVFQIPISLAQMFINFNTIFFNLKTKVKFNFGYYAFYSSQVMTLFTLAGSLGHNPVLYGHIESNTGGSTRQGNLRHPRVRFQSFSYEACILPFFNRIYSINIKSVKYSIFVLYIFSHIYRIRHSAETSDTEKKLAVLM